MLRSRVVKRAIVIANHKTSVSLEYEFWRGLKEIATLRLTNLTGLVSTIDSQREHGNLSSAIRLFVLDFYRGKAAEKLRHEMLGEDSAPPTPVLS